MKPAFRAGPVHVRAPATSANLGPGYDCFGLALGLYDDVVGRVADDGLSVDIAGEGAALPRDDSHLVVRAMRATFAALGGQPRGLELSCANHIPHGRGLGSSAAAIVSGVSLARALVAGGDQALPDPDAFALAARLEGHPDNVAACWHGGLTLAWAQDGVARSVRIDPAGAVRPVVLVPPFESSTASARGVLPATVPHADAAASAGRAALLVAVLSGAAPDDLLLAATEDRLHQAYRAPAGPQTAALVERLRADGLPAVVSGAGPSVLVLTRDEVEAERVAACTPHGWHCRRTTIDRDGARLVPAGVA